MEPGFIYIFIAGRIYHQKLSLNAQWQFVTMICCPTHCHTFYESNNGLCTLNIPIYFQCPICLPIAFLEKWVQYPIESEGISDSHTETEAVCTVSAYYYVAKIIRR